MSAAVIKARTWAHSALNGQGDIKGTKSVAWVIDHDTPDVASPLLSSGRIYFHKGKSGILSCVDAATGKPHYMKKQSSHEIDLTYASPVAAGGYIYLTGRSGTTAAVDQGRQRVQRSSQRTRWKNLSMQPRPPSTTNCSFAAISISSALPHLSKNRDT